MKKTLFVGVFSILAIVLVFGVTLVSCEEMGWRWTTEDTTFEFKIENRGSIPVTKVEIINGSRRSDPRLITDTVYIRSGETSKTYKTSGFTESDGAKGVFGILLTYEDGDTGFKYSSAAHQSKIHVLVDGSIYLR